MAEEQVELSTEQLVEIANQFTRSSQTNGRNY